MSHSFLFLTNSFFAIRLTVWLIISSMEFNSSLLLGPVCTSTPITISAPIFITSSTGKLLTIPPSANNLPSISIGVNIVGIAILALNASAIFPLSRTTASPVSRSVAIQTKGIGNFLKSFLS